MENIQPEELQLKSFFEDLGSGLYTFFTIETLKKDLFENYHKLTRVEVSYYHENSKQMRPVIVDIADEIGIDRIQLAYNAGDGEELRIEVTIAIGPWDTNSILPGKCAAVLTYDLEFHLKQVNYYQSTIG
jgi:hypothetical protein